MKRIWFSLKFDVLAAIIFTLLIAINRICFYFVHKWTARDAVALIA